VVVVKPPVGQTLYQTDLLKEQGSNTGLQTWPLVEWLSEHRACSFAALLYPSLFPCPE